MKFVAPFLIAGILGAVPAAAQDAPPPPPASATIDADGDSLTIGAGAVYLPDYEGSANYHLLAAPGAIGSYKGFSFQLAGNRFSADLIPNAPGPSWDIELGPVAVLNFNRSSLKGIDDPRVRALGKVNTGIELGGYAGIGKTGVITSAYDKLSLSVSYRHDVNGAHGSDILQPSINYLTPLSTRAAVGLFASAERVGRGYGRSYFDITPGQSVASGLPVHYTRAGWKNYSIGGAFTYALTGDLLHGFKLVAGGTYSRMLNDFGDSPVVSIAGDRNQWLGAVGVAYSF